MVDAADRDKIEPARNEIHSLLDKPQLAGIPVLVLGNKRDLPNALDEKEIIDQMWERENFMQSTHLNRIESLKWIISFPNGMNWMRWLMLP